MSAGRIAKSSTQRRKDAISRINVLGIQLLDMGRCTPCQASGDLCFVMKGYKKCSMCMKKDIRHCDGNFSPEEFDHIEAQKQKLRIEAQQKRQEVGRLAAAAAAAYAALAKAQQEEIDMSTKIDEFSEKQSRMLRQELDALDLLDGAGCAEAAMDFNWGDWGDLAGSEPVGSEQVVVGSSSNST